VWVLQLAFEAATRRGTHGGDAHADHAGAPAAVDQQIDDVGAGDEQHEWTVKSPWRPAPI